MIIIGLYIVLFLLSLIALISLLHLASNRRAGLYIVLFSLISVVCLAYVAYSSALDTGMALVANQFSYLDGTFIMLLFLCCLFDIGGRKFSPKSAVPIGLIGLFFLTLAFSAGYNKLFYAAYEYNTYRGSSHLLITFGPLYPVYVLFVVVQMLLPIIYVVDCFFHKKKISYKYTLALGLLLIAIVLLYFIQFTAGLGFDLLPCGYVLMEYVLLGIMARIGLYDVTEIAVDTSEKRKEVGYIIFDSKKAYVGSDPTAQYFFPELLTLDIDREVTDPFIRNEFVDWIDSVSDKEHESKLFSRCDRILMATIKPYVRGKKSKTYGYILEIRDDTDQQKLIETLNQMNGELEKAVEEATKANRAKSQFLANMSHEIRTPINAILGMNEIAIRQCQDDSISECLQDVKVAGINLLFLINDILDFSKIEAGMIELVEEQYSLEKMIRDVSVLLRIKAEDKNLELIVRADPTLPTFAFGDVNRIRQITINLLNNAVKYTQKGKVELNVFAQNLMEDRFELVLEVSDTGIGIKKADMEKLFISFSRVDQDSNKGIEGTGLGLAITKKLIERMGGTISVESEYGQGSVFRAVIPQIVMHGDPDETVEQEEEEQQDRKEQAGLNAEQVDILIVDDNSVNLKVAKGLLLPSKAHVETCMSGEECLEAIAEKHYDIILLDHMMPGLDGMETLRLAKENPDNLCEGSIFIALTANAIAGIRETYLEAGFDDYISKPINPKELENMLAKYIHAKK